MLFRRKKKTRKENIFKWYYVCEEVVLSCVCVGACVCDSVCVCVHEGVRVHVFVRCLDACVVKWRG